MTDYAAFLRGINVGGNHLVPMADLKQAFEDLGYADVRTIAISGNVVFSAKQGDDTALARKIEAALKKRFGYAIPVHVRSLDEIRAMLKADPYKTFKLPKDAKRVVTFLETGKQSALTLPHVEPGVMAVLKLKDGAAFSYYLRVPKAVKFMTVLEKAFGKGVTTRTWDMLAKLAK